jgi:hypothetical protein
MAKQSGLHQIRGKVGEHSYYKQTGVNAGLIRSINQGMSSRVKTAQEFANTRLNNAEFGQASRIAAVLGQLITPKYRPMILPFSQSKMAKIILDAIKTKTGNWGERNLAATDLQVILQAINSVHKNNPDEYGFSYSVNSDDEFVISSDETLFPAKMEAIGASGCDLVVLAARPWFGTYSATDHKYAQSFARANIYQNSIAGPSQEVSFDYAFRPAPPTGWPAFDVDFMVVVILPFRDIADGSHILQEHCTFVAMELPQGA